MQPKGTDIAEWLLKQWITHTINSYENTERMIPIILYYLRK